MTDSIIKLIRTLRPAAFVVIICAIGAHLLAQEKGADWANRLVVHNKGVGGQNSSRGLARFSRDVVAIKPDYVFIYFGLNDALNEKAFVTEQEFIKNLDAMIEASRRADIVPVLTTIHHVDVEALLKRHDPMVYGQEGPQKKIDRYNRAIRELAGERKVALADWCKMSDAIAQRLEQSGGGEKTLQPDGVHLTASGNERLASCYYETIKGDLREAQKIVCFGDSVTFGVRVEGEGTATGQTYPAYLRRIRLAEPGSR